MEMKEKIAIAGLERGMIRCYRREEKGHESSPARPHLWVAFTGRARGGRSSGQPRSRDFGWYPQELARPIRA